ncbi:MAG: hypothetical protein AUH44_00285 [Chloroflexi bacterium 13_1_40CM_68_15]|nr:MAG: hypothetical protein AUH44_00285 [Chloroflexi bacterium 13_1_40CM_68_15]
MLFLRPALRRVPRFAVARRAVVRRAVVLRPLRAVRPFAAVFRRAVARFAVVLRRAVARFAVALGRPALALAVERRRVVFFVPAPRAAEPLICDGAGGVGLEGIGEGQTEPGSFCADQSFPWSSCMVPPQSH